MGRPQKHAVDRQNVIVPRSQWTFNISPGESWVIGTVCRGFIGNVSSVHFLFHLN